MNIRCGYLPIIYGDIGWIVSPIDSLCIFYYPYVTLLLYISMSYSKQPLICFHHKTIKQYIISPIDLKNNIILRHFKR